MAAANLDLQGFVSAPDDASGLYQLSNTLEKNKQFDELTAERQAKAQQESDAKKTATASYLQSYLNPKNYLTGTVEDPYISQRIAGVLQKAMGMASQGVDAPTITMAISPDVSDISKASDNLKSIQAQKEAALTNVKAIKGGGIDENKYTSSFDNSAFYNTDANGNRQLKDISSIDPSKNYADEALKGDVYTNEGLNDFVKNSGHTVLDQNIKTRDANGKITQSKVDITKPNFMISDTDANGVHQGFVPKFNVATEGDGALIHTFKDDQGNDVKAPVRMVTDDVWDQLPPTSKGYIIQETKALLKSHNSDLPIGSTQAENLGKAIAYDELKNNAKDYSTMKRSDVNLQPLPPRTTINIGNQEPQTINLYKDVDDIVSAPKQNKFQATGINQLPATAQKTIIDIARNATGEKGLGNGDLFLNKDADGTINIRRVSDNSVVSPLDPLSMNVPVNQNVLKMATNKGKTSAVNKLDLSTGESGVVPKTGTSTKKAGGMSDDDYNNFLKKNKLK
jgi:hypothetical protein